MQKSRNSQYGVKKVLNVPKVKFHYLCGPSPLTWSYCYTCGCPSVTRILHCALCKRIHLLLPYVFALLNSFPSVPLSVSSFLPSDSDCFKIPNYPSFLGSTTMKKIQLCSYVWRVVVRFSSRMFNWLICFSC